MREITPVISATGLYTPPDSISNEELVASFNAYVTAFNAEHSAAIAAECQLVLVIGAPNSSNSRRLVEVAERCGTSARLIQRAAEIDPAWLEGVSVLGLTAGASAPESLVREVAARLGELRKVQEEVVTTAEENMVFKLPRQLAD